MWTRPKISDEIWRRAGQELLAKTFSELAFEGVVSPIADASGHFRVSFDDVWYLFEARRGVYDSYHVRAGSVRRRHADSEVVAWDPMVFVLDAQKSLALEGDTAGHLMRELTATQAADAGRLAADRATCTDLAALSYAELEGFQTGHPWLIPNKGRMGFSSSDVLRYAPEARQRIRLPWIAVHRSIAEYRSTTTLSQKVLLEVELDSEVRDRFTSVLTDRGAAPSEYHWLPVHPWQWDETILPLFGGEVAAGRIIELGEGPDRYLPQQSIRTMTNVDSPSRFHVKLPLSIFNTLVWRGLPTERTLAAPSLTAWILALRDADEFLSAETRVILLGEMASVTVRHSTLESVRQVPYQYRELLGAIWRESIHTKLDPGERARTLASLLYIDRNGDAFVSELVARSGSDSASWLRQLFHAVLPPLLHFLYRYGIVFSPHGENAIVIFGETELPTRLAIKDFVDDVNASDEQLPELRDMPADVAATLLREPAPMLCQFIQSGLFIGHFRYLSAICEQHLSVPEEQFWRMVRDEVLAYQGRFPDLADRYCLFDLLAPEHEQLCLNRNRLYADGYRDRAERPHAVVHGKVPNPLRAD